MTLIEGSVPASEGAQPCRSSRFRMRCDPAQPSLPRVLRPRLHTQRTEAGNENRQVSDECETPKQGSRSTARPLDRTNVELSFSLTHRILDGRVPHICLLSACVVEIEQVIALRVGEADYLQCGRGGQLTALSIVARQSSWSVLLGKPDVM